MEGCSSEAQNDAEGKDIPVGLRGNTDNAKEMDSTSFSPGTEGEEAAVEIVAEAARLKQTESKSSYITKIGCSIYNLESPEYTKLLQKEREEDNLTRRPKQAILHLALTDKRIFDLEEELEKVKAEVYGKPYKPWTTRPKNKHYIYRHLIKRSDAHEFRITSRTFDTEIEGRPALEVLVPGMTTQLNSDKPPDESAILDGSQSTNTIPERLRVRPRPLLLYLQQIRALPDLGFSLSPPETGVKVKESALVFLRPFKLFVSWHQELREGLQKLERKVSEKARSEIEAQDSGEAKDGVKWLREEDLLEDLRLLVELCDADLRPVFDLRQRISDGTATEICYSELWHLFRRGEMAFSQSNSFHAFRVVNYAGGRDLLIDRLRNEEDTKHVPSLDGFVVDCLCLEFDGSNYIPKLEKFSIRKFHGSRPITSLAIYPLRLHPEAARLEAQYREQGKLFLQLTRPLYCHKYMTGKTLDDSPHEVDGQVIVDASMALNFNFQWKPGPLFTEDDLTLHDKRETQMPPYCNHSRVNEGCCGDDVIHKDWEMDQLELSNYLRDSTRLFAPRKENELDEEELMLLPHWVHGFVLRSRRWAKMRTVDLSDVIFDNDFKALLLPERSKRAIQAMVATHENAKTGVSPSGRTVGSGIDVVKGKGTGLILLLHGEPGELYSLPVSRS